MSNNFIVKLNNKFKVLIIISLTKEDKKMTSSQRMSQT